VKATTTAQDRNEPTLSDVIEKLDKLAQNQERLVQDQQRFNERCSNYQQATQWVVQLAFTLIASATLRIANSIT
jgi:hypothetical protein